MHFPSGIPPQLRNLGELQVAVGVAPVAHAADVGRLHAEFVSVATQNFRDLDLHFQHLQIVVARHEGARAGFAARDAKLRVVVQVVLVEDHKLFELDRTVPTVAVVPLDEVIFDRYPVVVARHKGEDGVVVKAVRFDVDADGRVGWVPNLLVAAHAGHVVRALGLLLLDLRLCGLRGRHGRAAAGGCAGGCAVLRTGLQVGPGRSAANRAGNLVRRGRSGRHGPGIVYLLLDAAVVVDRGHARLERLHVMLSRIIA